MCCVSDVPHHADEVGAPLVLIMCVSAIRAAFLCLALRDLKVRVVVRVCYVLLV
jgi:hypothetical protein